MNRYLFQFAGAGVAIGYLIAGVLKSTSSTASVGLLFIPIAAALGAFVGDTMKYILDLIQKKRIHSAGKTALILVVFGLFAYQFVQTHHQNSDLKLAENPSTPSNELVMLLQKNDMRITHAVVSNPSLPQANLDELIDAHLSDYYLMSAAVQHPALTPAKMERMVSLERNDFKGDAEYEVYQTYVWAPLAKRKDTPAALIHRLAAKKNPQHFLILALLESPAVSCDEKKHFLPQTNPVLESAIHRSMETQKCAP